MVLETPPLPNNKIESSVKQQWNTNQGFGNWKIYYSMGIYFYLFNEVDFLLKKENRNRYLLNNIIKPKTQTEVKIIQGLFENVYKTSIILNQDKTLIEKNKDFINIEVHYYY